MSISLHPRKQPPIRLPWALTAAALTAFTGLAVSDGFSPMLPLLGLGLLATYMFAGRIEQSDWWVHWLLRLALYGAAGFLVANKLNEDLVDSFLTAQAMDTLGQMMAAELVIQAWRRQPSGGRQVASAIMLSGLTLSAASQTMDGTWARLFVPLYMFFLLLSLARVGQPATALRWTAVMLALGAGAATYGAVWVNRVTLTSWGTKYLEGRPNVETTGLSSAPTLGDTFGLRGSSRRVLRITGLNGITYLRGVTFETYQRGQWGPAVDHRKFTQAALEPNVEGTRAGVTPLAPIDRLLPVPLNCAGVDAGDNADPQWARENGGPVRVHPILPLPYEIIQSGDVAHQGPLAISPSPEERSRCLVVPGELDPGVRTLVARIAGQERAPRQLIGRVTTYLMAHHRYSLTIHPGSGDPVSNFLLKQPPMGAHCEYFAASAALLLRCLGVPTRYVVGYYAHEGDGPGVTVVRQRDAHAWAEAWVAGTGWVTVDATPGEGRPHSDENSIPLWQRLSEWVSDTVVAARSWIVSLNWSRVALWLVAFALPALMVRPLWRRLHPPPGTQFDERGYTQLGGDLAALAARFEALLARQGRTCPPDTPWQEHLAREGPPQAPSPPGPLSLGRGEGEQERASLNPLPSEVRAGEGEGRRLAAGERGAALAFVRAYNLARFGQAAEGETVRLAALLTEAERDLVTPTEKGDG